MTTAVLAVAGWAASGKFYKIICDVYSMYVGAAAVL